MRSTKGLIGLSLFRALGNLWSHDFAQLYNHLQRYGFDHNLQ